MSFAPKRVAFVARRMRSDERLALDEASNALANVRQEVSALRLRVTFGHTVTLSDLSRLLDLARGYV